MLTKRSQLPAVGADGADSPVVIVVHTLAHAIGALAAAAGAGHPVTILSAPDAGIYAGPGWFGAVIAAARAAAPDARFSAFLDCGDRPGSALGAIRAGIEGVIFVGRADVAASLADIARQHGVRFRTECPAVTLDLVGDFFATEVESERQCAAVLAQTEISPSRDRRRG